MDAQSDTFDVFNKELENIKKKNRDEESNNWKRKNPITEMRSTQARINSRLNDTEKWINE